MDKKVTATARLSKGEHRKVILDTDPGLDDAIALFFMMGRKDVLDPLAVTTVFGNVDINKTTTNALRLLNFLGENNVPVYRGAEHPLVRDRVSGEMIHGVSGLGDTVLPDPDRGVEDPLKPAAAAMAEKILSYPHEVTVITVGPMTNLALALRLYPEIKDKVQEIIVMGGAVGSGNRTVSAEYNVFADPHAAHIVLESELPLVMLGLDVTEKSKPGDEEKEFLENINHPAAQISLEFMEFFKKTFSKNYEMALHDACAVAYAINPHIFQLEPMDVRVELTGEHTFGRTVCSKGSEEVPDQNRLTSHQVLVGRDIDRALFFQELFAGYEGLDKK